MKYALFMGCVPYGATPEVKTSLEAVAKKLAIELVELKEASCCGATHLQDYDDFLSLVLNARNLAYAERLGLDLITVCNTCQLVLSLAASRLKNDRNLLARVNEKLNQVGLNYSGKTNVRHFLYALRDDYGFENLPIVEPLNDKKIAPFYGCHNIRPSGLSSNEDPFRPTVLDDLITALGGEAIDYSLKSGCCGFHTEMQASETTYKLSGEALSEASDRGAEWIVTPCPLCQLSFDAERKNAERAVCRPIKAPALHLTQLIGIALGLTQEELGLNKNVVKISL
ncbi:MAG: CoB--CoM heterodisulfide reductase iron-sulfur subunit B family protein [Helicobacteraceae bacterium]|jgi:succinate dehydrogenase / fumarate reductase cytochrome b subunit|nr:CoB--CoM heterodisulfide reductase iron-sulfur subunit B family protein [Helicobacteraceae bacterium]